MELRILRYFLTYRGVTQGVSDWFGDYYDKMDVFAVYNLVNNAATLVDCGMGAAITIEGAVALYKNPNIVFRPFYPELAFLSFALAVDFGSKHISTNCCIFSSSKALGV